MAVPRKYILRMQLLYRARVLQLLCLALLGVPLLGACNPDAPDTVVEVCGNLSIPEEIDSLRVEITDQDNNLIREGVRELWSCPGPSLMALPRRVEFAPVDGDVFVRIQGIRDGVPVIENTLRKSLNADDFRATVSLEQGCLGMRCGPGRTCSQGQCELIALASDTISACAGLSTHDTPDASEPVADAGSDAGNPVEPPGAYLCPQPEPDISEDPDATAVEDESGLQTTGADANEGS